MIGVLSQIKITAGDTLLYGTLFNNEPARDFAKLLPLTASLYKPADFAKAFDLPRTISDNGERTRKYELESWRIGMKGQLLQFFQSLYTADNIL